MTLPAVQAKLLEGRRGLIAGIANDRSIAWGCARAFRALGLRGGQRLGQVFRHFRLRLVLRGRNLEVGVVSEPCA